MNLIVEFEPNERAESIALKPYLETDYDASLGNDPYDMAANALIENNFEKLKVSEVIFIYYIGNEKDNFVGLILGHHIRLHSKLRQIPIVFIGTESLLTIWKSQPELSHLLLVKGIGYFSSEAEALEAKSRLMNETKLLNITETRYKESFLDKIVIPIPEEQQGRHGIANQWGAYRMAQVAGKEIDYIHPKTLYFKYLLALAKPPKPVELTFPTVKKILFIDDNYHKGWKDCLEGLFGKGTIEAYVSWQEAEVKGEDKKIKDGEYDLIFLDFYLGEQDRKGAGQDILEIIKGKKDENDQEVHKGLNSVVPVIMFTASNKAWNMDKLYEAGADGYYVKEHPDNAHDADFSVENFKNFRETVEKCLKKGDLLRKYWSKINQIKQQWNFTNKGNQKNRERIEERLTMFLGLLKKAYEQTNFDKQAFFYSEWELAFLTLWSTLNEVQEVYYEKHSRFVPFEYIDPSDTSQSKNSHPNRLNKIPAYFVNWQIRGGDYLIAYRPEFDTNGQPILQTGNRFYKLERCSKFCRDPTSSSGFRLDTGFSKLSDERWKYDKNLSTQIAFLVTQINLSTVLNRDRLLANLLTLNDDVRNKLYLTHGDDSSSPNFTVLYQDRRRTDTDWQEKIEQLFEIVYFLCTGKECVL